MTEPDDADARRDQRDVFVDVLGAFAARANRGEVLDDGGEGDGDGCASDQD